MVYGLQLGKLIGEPTVSRTLVNIVQVLSSSLNSATDAGKKNCKERTAFLFLTGNSVVRLSETRV